MYWYLPKRRIVPLLFLYTLFGLSLLAIFPSSAKIVPLILPGLTSHPDSRGLPDDVAQMPELIAERTATTATFDQGNGRYAMIAAAEAIHYQDEQGNWQIIDPAFQPLADSFVVKHNSLRSRVGQEQAGLSMAVGETAVHWQADKLGAVAQSGEFAPLAQVLPDTAAVVNLAEDGRTLRYTQGWSSQTLSEEVISMPGALEHTLVVSALPEAEGQPAYPDCCKILP